MKRALDCGGLTPLWGSCGGTKRRRAVALHSLLLLLAAGPAIAALDWVSPNHYRVALTVDPRGVARTNSPASVDIDLQKALADAGGSGKVDQDTIEVVGYDPAGRPRVFDASRRGYEQALLPWRVSRYFGIDTLTLSFLMPDDKCTQYAVYFDTAQSGLGKPKRYPGLVGDGDFFREGYKRREIGASHFDTFCDFDGDGDLDLFRGGVDPYVYCYENVGGNRYVDRGRLTNEGKLFSLPPDKNGRSWVTVEFFDWDGDGDLDFFPSFAVGYSRGNTRGNTWIYDNVTKPGGPLTFVDRGPLVTVSGKPLGMLDSFAGVTFCDLNGDGKTDVLLARDSLLEFHANVGSDRSIQNIKLADSVILKANGTEIQASTARFDAADIDSDGDLDLFCGSQHGQVYWFENVGTKTDPVFAQGRVIVFYEFLDAHSGVKVADFNGDGLLDIVTGRFWERTSFDDQPKFYGRLYANVGTKTHPRFEPRDAYHGCPYTEGFQMCDATRQNRVRAADWDGDGRTDLIASDTDGFIWLFRNTTNELCPVFTTGEKMTAGGTTIRHFHDCAWTGYAKAALADWDDDGLTDLIVLDSTGWAMLYRNIGTPTNPKLAAGVRLTVGDQPFEMPGFGGGIMVCDWDSDGKKDVVACNEEAYYFFRNSGTDAAPALTPPKRILFGPQDNGATRYWTRPNPGSYLDWDGDGKKDLISGEFEHKVRLYRNVGPGGPDTEPQFADPTGVDLVRPPAGMMVSGAEAVDWNRDGDIDILTGQGHGGGGLRFFERDYINDFVNNTFPVVTVGTAEHRP